MRKTPQSASAPTPVQSAAPQSPRTPSPRETALMLGYYERQVNTLVRESSLLLAELEQARREIAVLTAEIQKLQPTDAKDAN